MPLDKKQISRVTDLVMGVYKRVNPSFIENINSQKKKKEFMLKWSNLIVRKLKIPPILFQEADLLDIGCGTGEKSLVYTELGANVTGIDVNENAIAMAKKRAIEWGLYLKNKTKFRVSSVFEIEKDSLFDIVVSDGMIHHTADPEIAFDKFACLLRPGGVLILGVGEPCGFFQRQLQRYFVNKIAGSDNERLRIDIAMMLFKEKLERASKVSGRSIRAAAYDLFINPQIVPVAFRDIRKWMKERRIHMDCSWPSADLPLQTDSQYHPLLGMDSPAILGWEDLARLLWMLKDKYDREVFGLHANYNDGLSDFLDSIPYICTDKMLDTNKLKQATKKIGTIRTSPLPGFDIKGDFANFIKDILKIDNEIYTMKAKKFGAKKIAKRLNFKRLFSGFSGTGMVYYRGTKYMEMHKK